MGSGFGIFFFSPILPPNLPKFCDLFPSPAFFFLSTVKEAKKIPGKIKAPLKKAYKKKPKNKPNKEKKEIFPLPCFSLQFI